MSASMDIRIDRGLPYRATLTLYQDKDLTTPVDVTGWTFAAQVKEQAGATALATAAITLMDASAGEIQIDFNAAATAAVPEGHFRWDLLGEDAAGFQHLLAQGSVSSRTPISEIP